MATFVGTAGNDMISGTNLADSISGLEGGDTLDGRNGADRLSGGPGGDTLYGWAGADTLIGGSGGDYLVGDRDSIDDEPYAGDGADTIYGGTGNDVIDAGNGNDWASGGAGNDIIHSGYGNSQLYGDDGDDELTDYSGVNRLSGGIGNDRIEGVGRLLGGSGNDAITTTIGHADWTGGVPFADSRIDTGSGFDTVVVNLSPLDGLAGKVQVADFQPGQDRLLLTGAFADGSGTQINPATTAASYDTNHDGQVRFDGSDTFSGTNAAGQHVLRYFEDSTALPGTVDHLSASGDWLL